MSRLTHSRVIPAIDEVAVWSVVCLVVRPGFRRQGVTGVLVEGAGEYAVAHGASAIEAFPVEPEGRMDSTMAFVGTVTMFERAGFGKVSPTNARSGGLVRWVVRRELGW